MKTIDFDELADVLQSAVDAILGSTNNDYVLDQVPKIEDVISKLREAEE
jgi:hypothetical protein